jgi:hypothetical protein
MAITKDQSVLTGGMPFNASGGGLSNPATVSSGATLLLALYAGYAMRAPR